MNVDDKILAIVKKHFDSIKKRGDLKSRCNDSEDFVGQSGILKPHCLKPTKPKEITQIKMIKPKRPAKGVSRGTVTRL